MKNNLYWNVYKSLERELLALAEIIHIDDKQLDVYSMKIADLLIRTSVEIESISKELYFREGGTKPDDKDLYFDTDCLALLESKWRLSNKVVMVSSPILYLEQDENLYLVPLHKAYKRGTSSSDWQKAYQAVKHNRGKSLHKGTLKHFIRSLGALYLLNIYYQDQTFDLGSNSNGNLFDASIGSSVFSIQLHPFPGIDASGTYKKNGDFDKCMYLLQATDKTKEIAQKTIIELDNKLMEKVLSHVNQEFATMTEPLTSIDLKDKVARSIEKYKAQLLVPVAKENGMLLTKAFNDIRYEAVLNKCQY
ncbi:hypothetical protein AAH113_12790 [Parabacteroides distasonis]|uniref:hypothetical protein n=1 Tax=Parabacteroides distasonis TaxID=823 RepID=UPI0039B570D9